MKRSASPPEPPRLFDLPLGGETPSEPLPEHSPDIAPTLFSDEIPLEPEAAEEEPATDREAAAASERREPAEPPLRLADRALAGALDLGVTAGVLVVALAGAWLLGVEPHLGYWPAFAVFAAVFSFLYLSLPLAFWSQTPGMAWVGLSARNDGDEPLTFAQTALRWLGAAVTVVTLGLPLLLALRGRSLSDRLSGSTTRFRPRR